MATAVIPVQKIRIDSTLSTSLSRSSTVPPLVRKALKLWLFPHVLRFINSTLSGDTLARLNEQQVKDLYGPLNQFHLELNDVLETCSKSPWIERKLMGWWIKTVAQETEKLGDIVEALAWGADDDLRDHVNSSVAKLEFQLR